MGIAEICYSGMYLDSGGNGSEGDITIRVNALVSDTDDGVRVVYIDNPELLAQVSTGLSACLGNDYPLVHVTGYAPATDDVDVVATSLSFTDRWGL